MSEMFKTPRLAPVKDYGAALFQGAAMPALRDAPKQSAQPAAPTIAPAPQLSKDTAVDTLGKAGRKPTILTAPGQRGGTIADAFTSSKLG